MKLLDYISIHTFPCDVPFSVEVDFVSDIDFDPSKLESYVTSHDTCELIGVAWNNRPACKIEIGEEFCLVRQNFTSSGPSFTYLRIRVLT